MPHTVTKDIKNGRIFRFDIGVLSIIILPNMLEYQHSMFSRFTKRIVIDLGTANSLVWRAGEEVVMNEPTVVAVTVDDNRVVAVGNEDKDMLGRTPGNIMATRPMRDGVIADYRITEALLSYFIDHVAGRNRFFKPEV